MAANSTHLSAEQRRAVIVDTVIALAGEQNPGTITTAAIAKRMGLTQGALFRHFSSKEEVLQTVMRTMADRLMDRVEKAMGSPLPPWVALERIFFLHVDFIIEHPGMPRILFGELQQPGLTGPKKEAQALLSRYSGLIRGLVEQGKASGELDCSMDSEAAVILFLGAIQGLAVQSLIAGEVERIREQAPGIFRIYLRGIKHRS